jgi:hypothetical protein
MTAVTTGPKTGLEQVVAVVVLVRPEPPLLLALEAPEALERSPV